AVACVAEARHLQAVPPLDARAEAEQVLDAPARHDDILVHLGEAGVAQAVGELAAQLPQALARLGAEGALQEPRRETPRDARKRRQFPPDRPLVAVELDDDHGPASREP